MINNSEKLFRAFLGELKTQVWQTLCYSASKDFVFLFFSDTVFKTLSLFFFKDDISNKRAQIACSGRVSEGIVFAYV